jgi:hypothetical protein
VVEVEERGAHASMTRPVPALCGRREEEVVDVGWGGAAAVGAPRTAALRPTALLEVAASAQAVAIVADVYVAAAGACDANCDAETDVCDDDDDDDAG